MTPQTHTASVPRLTTKSIPQSFLAPVSAPALQKKSQQRPDLRSLATVTRHFMHRIPHRSFVDGENWVCAGGLRQYLVATIPATVASMFITQWSRIVHWGARHFQPKSVAAGVRNGGGRCWGLSGNVNLAHPFRRLAHLIRREGTRLVVVLLLGGSWKSCVSHLMGF